MVPTGREQVHVGTRVDRRHVGTVRIEVVEDGVDPRLEPGHPVDEKLRLVDVFADSGSGLPAVAVLANGDQQLRRCGVARDFAGDVAEDEKRRLCDVRRLFG